MDLAFNTLENTDLIDVLDTFNESFSDYIIAINLNIDQLSKKMLIENIDLNYSVGAFEKGRLIAFILHGKKLIQNKFVLYNGGTGVIPTKRGNNLTIKMYSYLGIKLKESNVSSVKLEVISNNVPAIKSYQKIGFSFIRKLNCYKGNLDKININKAVTLAKIQNPNWVTLENFWNTQPSWQNSTESISRLGNSLSIIAAYKDNTIVGYLALNLINNRILQIAIANDQRRKRIGSTLINYLNEIHVSQTSIINVDDNDQALNSFFKKIGFIKTLEQSEMVLELT